MEQTIRTRYATGLGLILCVVALGAFFVHRARLAPEAPIPAGQTATTTNLAGSTVQTGQGNQSGAVSITGANSEPGIPLPDITRAYTPPNSVPQSVQDSDKKIVAMAIEQIKFNPNQETYWLELANYRKNAGDYAGAEQIYLFLAARWPKEPIAFSNLADLYGNYTHDYAKAVVYGNKVIALDPKNISAYLNLATLERINMHDTASAKATLQAGLVINPNSVDLTNALAAVSNQ